MSAINRTNTTKKQGGPQTPPPSLDPPGTATNPVQSLPTAAVPNAAPTAPPKPTNTGLGNTPDKAALGASTAAAGGRGGYLLDRSGTGGLSDADFQSKMTGLTQGAPMPTESTGLGAPDSPGAAALQTALGQTSGGGAIGAMPDAAQLALATTDDQVVAGPGEGELPASSSIYDDVNELWGGSLQDALSAADAKTSLQQRQLAESTADLGAAAGGGNSMLAAAQGMAYGRANEIDARMQHAMKGMEMKLAQFNAILGSEEAAKDRNLTEKIQAQRDALMMDMKLLDQGYVPEFDANGDIIGVAPPNVAGNQTDPAVSGAGNYAGGVPTLNLDDPNSANAVASMSGEQWNAAYSGLSADAKDAAQSAWQDAISSTTFVPGSLGGMSVEQQQNVMRNLAVAAASQTDDPDEVAFLLQGLWAQFVQSHGGQ